jgi:hypothetical protein
MIDPNAAVDYIIKHSREYAIAKANVVYMEQYRKTQKAICYQASTKTTIADKEADAYAHEEYIAVLDGLKEAVEDAEQLRWMLVAAQARIDIWRSQEASNRNVDRNTK